MKQKWTIQQVGDGMGWMMLRLAPVEGRGFIPLTGWFDIEDWKVL